jgi:hypothetical protein
VTPLLQAERATAAVAAKTARTTAVWTRRDASATASNGLPTRKMLSAGQAANPVQPGLPRHLVAPRALRLMDRHQLVPQAHR